MKINWIIKYLKIDLVYKICCEMLTNHFIILLFKNILWKFILHKDLEQICFHPNVKIALNKSYILPANVITYNYLL